MTVAVMAVGVVNAVAVLTVAVAVRVAVGRCVAVGARVTIGIAVGAGVAMALSVAVPVEYRRADGLQETAELEADLGGCRRLPRVAAAEDDVFHLVAAQALGALLAHHPGDGVGDVALAASVGADNRRHPFVEGQL